MATVYRDVPAQSEAVPPAEFRALMAGFPTGVAVVTAFGEGGQPWGMTCSSVCSVTLSPPTLLVCLRQGSATLAAVRYRSVFALNLLHVDARPTAVLFASGAPTRFDMVRWHAGPGSGGPHLAEDAHAIADCRVSRVEPVGDHAVVFGEARHVSQATRHLPLLYGLRRYADWPVEPGPRGDARYTPVSGA